ncbi:hypothetical protein K402DRAFT_392327 [Aulographum hederae CBS 113979]|uniref:Uncharacterized protein n=1 Tax=Aulographum hederae CBS 113979 TaxID=1176131 RepID=A0A6G1H4H5_9PEZI|nr:hypothetical protein K402DRAFT_392327 [Aulographum hederae CBS 113979]
MGYTGGLLLATLLDFGGDSEMHANTRKCSESHCYRSGEMDNILEFGDVAGEVRKDCGVELKDGGRTVEAQKWRMRDRGGVTEVER